MGLQLVLMKMCMGISNKGITVRFNVTDTVISNILRNWQPVMAQMLKPIMEWPTSNAVFWKIPPKMYVYHWLQCHLKDLNELRIMKYN